MTLEKNENGELDVRVLIPIQRHELLVGLFKDLPTHENFVFINDHDPIPLYYEFKSIYGDVVGWEYLNRGGREWKVRVTRTEDSQARDMSGIATLLDLRNADKKEWKQVVFHRYGMMEEGTTMELIAREDLQEIHGIFKSKFAGMHTWMYKKEVPDEYVIHIRKEAKSGLGDDGYSVVNEFDVRPYPPTERHEMFYKAFGDIKPGEAFEFVNDHDPKPLYYQMEAESKEPFRWEYLEKGPEVWKVRVVKVEK
ncbi:MAG: DUF2249 domain-containing protein [Saprospiraceae bacterium]|jgi:uncharacterized protein (DUF2249 family)|nr:MAG: hemerythrin hhE cation binding domain-containing protein [Candidatus Parvibacillus calidus]MBX2936356.1 DUF2249 domain-containing protein [Saprospiraceae bacterium]MBK7739164.1 DUF2249 domain-containing protein [Candidatus Parvibacillus calidus]MBX7179837.1 DUF2249 domain-containing protein [Saprospiraceae bacterium]MCB0592147.1 DUF2249 domain-containing protein [Saprospiraceae bacterium]